MKQTAVEWLADYLCNAPIVDYWGAVEKAKEMEKEQIIKAHEQGFYSPPFRMSRRKEAEQYYQETFKPE